MATKQPEESEIRATKNHGSFEVAGKTLHLKGTSGASKYPERIVGGRPVRHDLTVAGRVMLSTGTSGMSTLPNQTVAGRPVHLGPEKTTAARMVRQVGAGQIIGRPKQSR
jgi:hypothetical protein